MSIYLRINFTAKMTLDNLYLNDCSSVCKYKYITKLLVFEKNNTDNRAICQHIHTAVAQPNIIFAIKNAPCLCSARKAAKCGS